MPERKSQSERLAMVIPFPTRMLRTKPAAGYLGMSDKMLRKLAQAGKIPFLPNGEGPTAPWLFDIRDLDTYIEKSKIRF
jgi:hypothetical protein